MYSPFDHWVNWICTVGSRVAVQVGRRVGESSAWTVPQGTSCGTGDHLLWWDWCTRGAERTVSGQSLLLLILLAANELIIVRWTVWMLQTLLIVYGRCCQVSFYCLLVPRILYFHWLSVFIMFYMVWLGCCVWLFDIFVFLLVLVFHNLLLVITLPLLNFI